MYSTKASRPPGSSAARKSESKQTPLQTSMILQMQQAYGNRATAQLVSSLLPLQLGKQQSTRSTRKKKKTPKDYGHRISKNKRPRKNATKKSTQIRRPGFTTDSKKGAYLAHNLSGDSEFQVNISKPGLPGVNAAMPHRMSYANIRDNAKKFLDGDEKDTDLERWTGRFIEAGQEKLKEVEQQISDLQGAKDDDSVDKRKKLEQLKQHMQSSQNSFVSSRDTFKSSPNTGTFKEFVKFANSFHANVPDLGPHDGVNNPVRERAHLNFREVERGRKRTRSPSPMTRRVLDMSPERISGIASTTDGELITTSGKTLSVSKLSKENQKRVKRHQLSEVKSYNPNAKFGHAKKKKKK